MSSPDNSKLKVSSSSGTGDGFSDREQSKLEGGAELLLASPGDSSSSSSTSGEYLVHAPNAQRKVTSRMEQLNAANVGTSVFPVCCFFGSFHSFWSLPSIFFWYFSFLVHLFPNGIIIWRDPHIHIIRIRAHRT